MISRACSPEPTPQQLHRPAPLDVAAAQVLALAVFFLVSYPVNLRLPIGDKTVPADWAAAGVR